MKHRIISTAQLAAGVALLRDDAIPDVRGEIGGDVHRAAVADDEHGLVERLGHAKETVLQLHLGAEGGLLPLEEEILVRREVVHARLSEHRGHLGDGKHLIAKA